MDDTEKMRVKNNYSSKNKKIIYIMGCGRSGSTILGFILNNGRDCLDLGELNHYLPRNGEPNGFRIDSENGTFWNSVKKEIFQKNNQIFNNNVVSCITNLEYHTKFPLIYHRLVSKASLELYSEYINSLYNCIGKQAPGKSFFIDSSKYPGRALLLSRLLEDYEVFILHLVRHPVCVVNSMSDRSKAGGQGFKNFWSSNLYYFIVNFFCSLVLRELDEQHYLRIRYEELVDMPETQLKRIEHFTGISFEAAIDKIRNGQPLDRGFIFNGNRMRMKEKVFFRREHFKPEKTLKNDFTQMINKIWH